MWYPHTYLFLILIFWCAIIQRISAHQQSYYHYPAPHQHQQFHETNLGITSNFEPSFGGGAGAASYYRTQHHQTTYQSPQLITQHYVPQQHQPLYYQQKYAATAPPLTSPPPTPAKIVKEFSSPQLESVAFTMALTRQGYVVVGNSHQPHRQHHHQHNLNDARVVPQATSAAQRQQLVAAPQPQISAAATTATTTTANTGRAFMTMMMMLMTTLPHSQNVKLPLPLGVTPLSFNPLPLQAGAPYSSVRGLTSYGTTYPQRRRR